MHKLHAGRRRELLTGAQAIQFVKRHGIVLQRAKGAAPNLAEAIAGGPIRGSWWAHPKGQEMFRAFSAVHDAPDVLACRLVDGKVTFVHRRLWAPLVRLARSIGAERLGRLREEHTASGAHKVVEEPFPRWVPAEVREEARGLDETEARRALASYWVYLEKSGR